MTVTDTNDQQEANENTKHINGSNQCANFIRHIIYFMYAFKCLHLNTKAWIPNPGNLSDVEMLWMAGLLVQWTIPNIHKDFTVIHKFAKTNHCCRHGERSFVFVGEV